MIVLRTPKGWTGPKEIDRNISNIEQLKARDDENETIQSRTTIG